MNEAIRLVRAETNEGRNLTKAELVELERAKSHLNEALVHVEEAWDKAILAAKKLGYLSAKHAIDMYALNPYRVDETDQEDNET